MPTPPLDLTRPDHAYFFGFVQGDGSLYRNKDNPNKGRLSIELSLRDQDIVFRFKAMFPESTITYRRRATNFAEDYQSIVWTMCRQEFREDIEACGVPVGKKSFVVRPPDVPFSVPDYWRGVVDADGSIGITKAGVPFVSLITVSEAIARAFESFLQTITGKEKHTNRNTRDQAFNIMVTREDAMAVAKTLYPEGCLALDRKAAKAKEVLSWVRPVTVRRRTSRVTDWTPAEDAIILSMTPKEAQLRLGRSRASVSCRLRRLRPRFVIKDNEGTAEGSA
jgi:hypothetical protein